MAEDYGSIPEERPIERIAIEFLSIMTQMEHNVKKRVECQKRRIMAKKSAEIGYKRENKMTKKAT